MRVVVGRIGRPHGIRGEVTVEPRTDEPDIRFAPGSSLLRADGGADLVVDDAHWHSGRLLVAFVGVEDRNAAEAIRGTVLEIDRDDDEVPDGEDEYYDSALIGSEVVDHHGVVIGVVREVAHLPAQDLLVIERSDAPEILLPFVIEFVPEIDVTARRIVIHPPDGLIEADE